MIKRILYVDGVASNKANPETFHIPTKAEKRAIGPYMSIKVGVYAGFDKESRVERFWLTVTHNDIVNKFVHGRILNHLYLCGHGLDIGNTLIVPYHAILGIDEDENPCL